MPYKICATSDLHGWLPEIPDCNALLIAGDICPASNHKVQYQRNWLMGSFWHWLDELRKRGISVFGICGNHDFIGQERREILDNLPWCYLHDGHNYLRTPKGYSMVYGCPHTKEFFNWAFMKTDAELHKEHSKLPDEVKILITHGPPHGYGDIVLRAGGVEDRIGSPGLTEWIERVQPALVVCGHNHGNQGTFQLGKTIIANVAFLGDNYQPKYPPQVFELDI